VVGRREPQAVLLTIDSLGDADPALIAHPDLPVVVVFDDTELAAVRPSAKRLVFWVETLLDLSTRRDVALHLGDPADIVPSMDVAVTWAPVPESATWTDVAAEVHPWPWLVPPHGGSVASFSAWRRRARVRGG
jgi:deoxyribodipyrimidine photo-lyase